MSSISRSLSMIAFGAGGSTILAGNARLSLPAYKGVHGLEPADRAGGTSLDFLE